MMKVVVSQPMLFPWVGLLEQVRQADIFVHYDDVQLPIGRSFCSRVQVKTREGIKWLTVPVLRAEGQLIKEAIVDESQRWRERARGLLERAYAQAPYQVEMLDIFDAVTALETSSICEISISSVERLADYFGLKTRFLRSSQLNGSGSGTERLVAIIQELGGNTYVTGHGARNYLDHEQFEHVGIRVEYMDYRRKSYPQRHGPFDPHLTSLDLVANTGRVGVDCICSGTVYWKEFINERN